MTDAGTEVGIVRVTRPTEEVLRRFLDANEPVMIDGMMASWRACEEWVNEDGGLRWDFLERNFGHEVVPVVECAPRTSDQDATDYGGQARHEMTFGQYLSLLRGGEAKARGLYLKDWHFVKAFPDYRAYEVPPPLNDDWLNEWWDVRQSGRDDYRFVYLGPAGTSTPMHHDVLLSCSWSANVVGEKLWTLFEPCETPRLYAKERPMSKPSLIPDPSSSLLQGVPRRTVIQRPGEILFVPAGWHHHVLNTTEVVLSINHNWFNGSNVERVWAFLKSEAEAVRSTLLHLKDTFDAERSEWERQCEVVMRANSAVNLTDFCDLLVFKSGELLKRDDKKQKADLANILMVLEEMSRPPLVEHVFPPEIDADLSDRKVDSNCQSPPDGVMQLPSTCVQRPILRAWLQDVMSGINAKSEKATAL